MYLQPVPARELGLYKSVMACYITTLAASLYSHNQPGNLAEVIVRASKVKQGVFPRLCQISVLTLLDSWPKEVHEHAHIHSRAPICL